MLRYIARCSVITKYKNFVEDQEFGVINPVEINSLLPHVPIKYEVGIEDWLHLIFEFERTKYHSKDCVSGTVTFKKVSIRLKSMELQIIKKETIGAGKSNI
jgi:vacuolar protein sorting-associated protein 26